MLHSVLIYASVAPELCSREDISTAPAGSELLAPDILLRFPAPALGSLLLSPPPLPSLWPAASIQSLVALVFHLRTKKDVLRFVRKQKEGSTN